MDLDTFLDALDNDLAWRKKEISDLQMLCSTNENEILLKSMILILYAHWEGFIKNASKSYLIHVSELRLSIGELTLNYKTISMKGLIKSCFESNEALTLANEMSFINKFVEKDNAKFLLQAAVRNEKDKSVVDTKDNLSSEVFTNLCKIVGLPEKDCIVTKKNLLDEHFLNNRNVISHGSKLMSTSTNTFSLDHDSVLKLKDLILAIMSSFQDDLKEYAVSQFYFKENNVEKEKYDKSSDLDLKKTIRQLAGPDL